MPQGARPPRQLPKRGHTRQSPLPRLHGTTPADENQTHSPDYDRGHQGARGHFYFDESKQLTYTHTVARPQPNPHTRAIGGTFELTFVLPKPANTGNTRPKKPKHTKPGRKTRAGTANHKSATKPAKPRLTEEQKRELRRVLAAEDRQRGKELGLCKDCPARAIKGKTRCPKCAEEHRQAHRAQRVVATE